MFDQVDDAAVERGVQGMSDEELNQILEGTEGFSKFVMYCSLFRETQNKLAQVIQATDVNNEGLYKVFEDTVRNILDSAPEVLFSVLSHDMVRKAIAEILGWDEGFIERSEEKYQKGEAFKTADEQTIRFLTYRVNADILIQNFNSPHVMKEIFSEESDEKLGPVLQKSVNELIQEKFQIDLSQFVYLAYVMGISMGYAQLRKKDVMAELKKISSGSKGFFNSEQKAVLKDMLTLIMK